MKMRKGFISAPLWVYIILSVVTIGSLVIGTSCDSELLKNTGYSLFASLVVAFVIDVGNTITSRKRDEKLFRIITKDYVSAFLRLRESAIGLCDDGDLSENEEHTFKEWLNKAIERPEEAVSELKEQIKIIENEADTLAEAQILLINNDQFSEDYLMQTKKVRSIAGFILRLLDGRDPLYATTMIEEILLPLFIKSNPVQKTLFVEKYGLKDLDNWKERQALTELLIKIQKEGKK